MTTENPIVATTPQTAADAKAAALAGLPDLIQAGLAVLTPGNQTSEYRSMMIGEAILFVLAIVPWIAFSISSRVPAWVPMTATSVCGAVAGMVRAHFGINQTAKKNQIIASATSATIAAVQQ